MRSDLIRCWHVRVIVRIFNPFSALPRIYCHMQTAWNRMRRRVTRRLIRFRAVWHSRHNFTNQPGKCVKAGAEEDKILRMRNNCLAVKGLTFVGGDRGQN